MICVLVSVYTLIVSTSSDDVLPARTINLELDTTFLFDKGDAHSPLVKGLRTLLNKIDRYTGVDKKSQMKKSKYSRRSYENIENSNMTLTRFMKMVGIAILKYSDEELKKMIEIMNAQIEKRFNTSTFNEVIVDSTLRSFINNTLKKWLSVSPSKLKEELEHILLEPDYSPLVRFFTALNQFYNRDDIKQFKQLLIKFDNTDPTVDDLEEVVKDIINNVIIKRFSKLNSTSKAILAKEMAKVSNFLGTGHKEKEDYRRKETANKFWVDSKELSEGEIDTIIVARASNSFEEDIEISEEDALRRNNIIINKNFDIFVRVENENNKKAR